MIDLSILIVNWKTRDLLKNCLHSIINNTRGLKYEIVVVDNDSCDGSVEMIQKYFKDKVKLIVNKKMKDLLKEITLLIITVQENIF